MEESENTRALFFKRVRATLMCDICVCIHLQILIVNVTKSASLHHYNNDLFSLFDCKNANTLMLFTIRKNMLTPMLLYCEFVQKYVGLKSKTRQREKNPSI